MVIGLPLKAWGLLGVWRPAVVSVVTLEILVVWPRLYHTQSSEDQPRPPLPCLALLFIVLSTKNKWTGHQTYLVTPGLRRQRKGEGWAAGETLSLSREPPQLTAVG